MVIPVREGALPERWRAAAAADGFTGAAETVCEVFPGVVLVGLGAAEAAGACGVSRLLRHPSVALDVRGLAAGEAASMIAGACLRAWRFDRWRSRADDAEMPRISVLEVLADDPAVVAAWERCAPGIEGALFARDLVSEPANVLTPSGFVERLASLARAGIGVEVLHGASLAAFGGVRAVGQGSVHAPCVAVLRWAGAGGAPVALVGKGITFDTGGICIKPADGMWAMRADMAGAAACAGAMLAVARRGSPVAVMAVLPLAENAVGAASYRPGDVLRMLSGATVQVVDTDAEGRLVLADALALAIRDKPACVIDLATLTGSIVAALGHERAGLFSNDDALAAEVAAAGEAAGELVWRMPIAEGHRRSLDSDIADLKHCVDGRGQPDACQAAAFLREFVGDVPWAHLDIAGVEAQAEASLRHAQGASGFGARLLDRLVAARAAGRAA